MSKLSMGIVGLPNVGKSTLFNALTQKSVPMENYPFCTIDPSVGVVAVPDERLWALSEFSNSARTLPASIEFVDIAGLVSGASQGEGLGNQFLANIREVDAIAQVVRIYDDANLAHVSGDIDPMRDIEVINLELILADMQTVSRRRSNLVKEVKAGNKDAIAEDALCAKLIEAFEVGRRAATLALSDKEKELMHHLHLLSAKPILYVLNRQSGGTNLDDPSADGDERYAKLHEFLKGEGASWVIVDAKSEYEMSEMDVSERNEIRSEFGIAEGQGVDALIQESYAMLGLITFFTTGEMETRGWTILEGSTAPEAGTAIHSDFHDKFIRAEVIHWKDLIDAGSTARARERGLIRTEGKGYIVKDGDVIEFRI